MLKPGDIVVYKGPRGIDWPLRDTVVGLVLERLPSRPILYKIRWGKDRGTTIHGLPRVGSKQAEKVLKKIGSLDPESSLGSQFESLGEGKLSDEINSQLASIEDSSMAEYLDQTSRQRSVFDRGDPREIETTFKDFRRAVDFKREDY